MTKLANLLQSLNHPVKIIGLTVVAEIDARRHCRIAHKINMSPGAAAWDTRHP